MKKILLSIFVSVWLISCGLGGAYGIPSGEGPKSFTPDVCFVTVELANGGLEITGFESTLDVCKGKILAIPATRKLDGKKYVSIVNVDGETQAGLFANNNFIESVIGGENLESIGAGAFATTTALTSVNLPNVKTIGTAAFDLAKALTSINLPKVTTIGAFAFNGASALISVSFPNVMKIGRQSFYSTTSLTSISLGSNLTEIGEQAFANGPTPATRTFTMAGVNPPTTIGVGAFGAIGSNIYVPSDVAVVAWNASTDPEFTQYKPYVKKQP